MHTDPLRTLPEYVIHDLQEYPHVLDDFIDFLFSNNPISDNKTWHILHQKGIVQPIFFDQVQGKVFYKISEEILEHMEKNLSQSIL